MRTLSQNISDSNDSLLKISKSHTHQNFLTNCLEMGCNHCHRLSCSHSTVDLGPVNKIWSPQVRLVVDTTYGSCFSVRSAELVATNLNFLTQNFPLLWNQNVFFWLKIGTKSEDEFGLQCNKTFSSICYENYIHCFYSLPVFASLLVVVNVFLSKNEKEVVLSVPCTTAIFNIFRNFTKNSW